MKINKSYGLAPPILGFLAGIGEFEYSYKYYRVKHPGAIFNATTIAVFADFEKLISEIKTERTKVGKTEKLEINSSYKMLLSDFFKFYDSCYEIMLGCCKQHAPPSSNEELWRWLKNNKYTIGERFFKRTKDDTAYFRKMNNALKHTGKSIQTLVFITEREKILGYFVDAPLEDGSRGPDPLFHPSFNGRSSANSYYLTLRNLYFAFYKTSEVLRAVLQEHFREVYKKELPFVERPATADSKEEDRWRRLYEEIINLPPTYFPNEFGKEVCVPRIWNDTLILAITHVDRTDLRNAGLQLITSGDGYTRSFKLPF